MTIETSSLENVKAGDWVVREWFPGAGTRVILRAVRVGRVTPKRIHLAGERPYAKEDGRRVDSGSTRIRVPQQGEIDRLRQEEAGRVAELRRIEDDRLKFESTAGYRLASRIAHMTTEECAGWFNRLGEERIAAINTWLDEAGAAPA